VLAVADGELANVQGEPLVQWVRFRAGTAKTDPMTPDATTTATPVPTTANATENVELALGPRGRLRSAVPAAAFAYAAGGVWLAVFWTFGVERHRAFQTARLDLGNMAQALYNTTHGRFLEATTLGGNEASRLAGHVDPLLAVFAPLWWLWSSPLLLVSISAIALASGVLPVYWLARKHLSDRAAREFALVYLLCPLTQWNAIWDFHPVSLAIPLILYAIWFLDEDRLIAFATVALLAAASKEEIPLAVGCLGIWYARAHGRRLVGAIIFAVGAALTFVDFLVVIPHFASGENPFAGRYTAVGGSPKGILHLALTHPERILRVVLSGSSVEYVVVLTLLFGGIFFVSPLFALGAVPDLVINVLSNDPNQTSFQFQYTAGVLPFLLAATIFGAARLRRRLPSLPTAALAVAIVGCLVLGPLSTFPSVIRGALPGNSDREAKADAVALIPSGVAVSASNQLAGHLSVRRRIYVFPAVGVARWIVVDPSDVTELQARGFHASIGRIESMPEWRLVYERRGIMVFHRA
jgi:uncharacterized membrane protein